MNDYTRIERDFVKNLQPWVKEEVVPFAPKPMVLIAINHYKNAQTAWDAWTIPTEMVCALIKTNAPLGKLALCTCDLVAPAFGILRSGRVDHRPFRAGIRIAKQLAETQSDALLDPVLDAIGELTAIFKGLNAPINVRYAAWAIIRAVRSAVGKRPALDVPFLVERAILASLKEMIAGTPPRCRLLPRIENSRLTDGRIREWQCRRIRKHFPERPHWTEPDAPYDSQCPPHLFGHLLSSAYFS